MITYITVHKLSDPSVESEQNQDVLGVNSMVFVSL